MIISSLVFLVGAGSLFLLPQLPSGLLVAGLILLGSLLFWFKRASYPLMIFIVGFSYAWLNAHFALESQLPEKFSNKVIKLEGVISNVPQKSINRTKFNLKIENASIADNKLKLKHVKLSWYNNAPDLQQGQKLSLHAKLKRPHGSFNNSGFDYEKWLLSNRIDASGYVKDKMPYQISQADDLNLSNIINRLREHTKANYLHHAKNYPLLTALLLGDRSSMTEQHWQILRKTGTSHLMAISGLHLGLVALAVLWLARKILIYLGNSWLALNSLYFATLIALAVALFYAVLAGFSIPTQRAFIMLLLAGIALISIRPSSKSNLFALALIICLMIDPFYLLSAGFWLSFMAVFWLLIMPKVKNWWLMLLIMQFILGLGLLPVLSILGFGASIIAMPANLIALPVVSFIVLPSLFLGFVFSYFDFSIWLLFVADETLSLLWNYLDYISRLPNVFYQLAQITLWQAIIASIGLVILILPKNFPLKLLGLLLFLNIFVPKSNGLAQQQVKITVIDVGQGLSVLVETQNHNLLFDVGAKSYLSPSVFTYTIKPLLINKNIATLDKLIISHADNDHSGGFNDVLNDFEVLDILSSTPKLFKNSRLCTPQVWTWDQVNIELLHPGLNSKLKGNDASCVLHITNENYSMLLTSDIEYKGEIELMKNQPKLFADVLLVPHHGSKTSSSEQLLESLKPKFGIIPSGYHNRFKHPHKIVVNRLKRHNIELSIIGNSGAVEVLFKDKLQIIKYRQQFGKFWHLD